MQRRTLGRIGCGVLLVIVAAAGLLAREVVHLIRRQGQIARSMDNLRTLLLHESAGPADGRKPLPPYGGKRWFLRLVAAGLVSKSDPKQLEILFSPGDDARSLAKAGGPAAYARIVRETLDDPAFDPSALTSYAGPRLGEQGPRPPSAASPDGDPIVADLSFPGTVLLGFPGGKVQWVEAEELGLPPGEPIVVGDASPNEWLRRLSDR